LITSSPLIAMSPGVVNDAILTATDVPEADYPVYSAATTYPFFDESTGAGYVIYLHMIYYSIQAGNAGHAPDVSPLWWEPVRATNRWAGFDTRNSTKTRQANAFYFELSPATNLTAVAVLGLEDHTSVRLRQTHPTLGVLYDVTQDFSALPEAAAWYDWTFGNRSFRTTQKIFFGLRPFPGTTLRLDFAGGSGLAVGTILYSYERRLGSNVEVGATPRIRDFSERAENKFGDTYLKQGQYTKDTTLPMKVPLSEFDGIYAFLVAQRSIPTLYIGNPDIEALTVFGFYDDFSTVFSYPTLLDLNINIKGLT
jgi:hypothetical protein